MLILGLLLASANSNLVKTVDKEILSVQAQKLIDNMEGWSSLYYATNVDGENIEYYHLMIELIQESS
jgi:hypothetical protein